MKRLLSRLLPRRDLENLFLFVHLPKCAGTSLLKMFSELGPKRFLVVAGNRTKKQAIEQLKTNLQKRSIYPDRLDMIAGRNVYYGMHEEFTRPPFYFTFVREPIERFISHYSYLRSCAGDPSNETYEMACRRIKVEGRIISIREFVERNQSRNLLTTTLAAASSDEETSNSWWDISPQIAPERAKWMLDQMSFIGFVERFDSDARNVCKLINLHPQTQRINASNSKHLEIDKDTMKLIRAANELDLETYEYAQNISSQKL